MFESRFNDDDRRALPLSPAAARLAPGYGGKIRMKAAWIMLLALLLGVGSAQAANETWVSRTGTDTGTCPITAPCKTFAFAHDQTNNNGAINVLSSGNFGPLTITKPISIVAEGVEAVINSGASGAGIIVQAGPAAIVSLRGLTIDLRGTDNDGISFVAGAALHVHHSVIRRGTFGILFGPTSGTSELYIADTLVADSSSFGVSVQPAESGSANVVLERVRVEKGQGNGCNFTGQFTTGSIAATVRDGVSAGNAGAGIVTTEIGSGTTTVMIDRSTSANNGGQGITAIGARATVRMGNSTVTGNATGLTAGSSGVIASYGTNKIDGNGTDGAPTPLR